MIASLSILIPVHNSVCISLVHSLLQQAVSIEGLRYEILVADDGSTNEESKALNRQINKLPHCRFIERGENVGRAAIRNYLASKAQNDYLLFLDSDVRIHRPDFLLRYLQCEKAEVVHGGYELQPERTDSVRGNLRYRYEESCKLQNSVKRRALHPYKSFKTSNYFIRREIMLACPFDERLRRYGYEDILMGKKFMQQQVEVKHIDNPVVLYKFDSNAIFLQKTHDALQNLVFLSNEMPGFTQIQRMADKIVRYKVEIPLLLAYKILQSFIKRHLLGRHPQIFIYNIYRLCTYLRLRK